MASFYDFNTHIAVYARCRQRWLSSVSLDLLYAMTGDPDWRITNQEKYLMDVSLVHRRYEPAAGDDHDHCPFCWAKFMVQDYPDVLHEGYATLDSAHWICAQCFHDFRERFRWQLVPDATSQI